MTLVLRSACIALVTWLAGCGIAVPSERGGAALPARAGDGEGDAAAEGAADAVIEFAAGRGLRLARRDQGGSFLVSTKHVVNGSTVVVPHPSTEWDCDLVTAGSTPDGKLVLVSHVGCEVVGPTGDVVEGDFDVHQLFDGNVPGEVGVRAWVHNRLAVGMETFRMVLRIDPSSMPANGDDAYVYFANDEVVQNPVAALGYDTRDVQHPFLWTGGYDVESHEGRRGFYANRGNTKPLLSVHTPDWGFVFHETEPVNVQTGTLLVGSNAGALEIGYGHLLPHDLEPGNASSGPIEIGAGFRAVALPAEGPPADQWWEAAEVYRAWALEAGLIPPETLPESSFPAEWAEDCEYMAFNVNFDVDVETWADDVTRLARFHQGQDGNISGRAVEDGGQRSFCILLWSWSRSGPYAPAPGVVELLRRFEQLERDEGVEIHPMIYVLSAAVELATTRGTPIEDAWLHDEYGDPYVWDGAVPIDPAHPAFRADVLGAVSTMIGHGVDGVYFDAPFAHALRDYRRHGGVDRAFQLGVRDLMNETADMLTEAGGGTMVHELAVAGLPGLQGGSGVMMPNARNVPFSEALWHDRQVGAFSGDLGLGIMAMLFADTSWSCGASCEPGLPDNLRHIQRLAIEGAVLGRAAADIPPRLLSGGWLFELGEGERAQPLGAALDTYARTSLPNAMAARRRVAALRTGRMLRPPASDSPRVDVGYRIAGDGRVLYRRAAELYPSALYEDLEAGGQRVLVVGNPTATAATVTFTMPDGETVAVDVPPYDVESAIVN